MGISGIGGPRGSQPPSSSGETPEQQIADMISLLTYWAGQASLSPPVLPPKDEVAALIKKIRSLENNFPNDPEVKRDLSNAVKFLSNLTAPNVINAHKLFDDIAANLNLPASDFSLNDMALLSSGNLLLLNADLLKLAPPLNSYEVDGIKSEAESRIEALIQVLPPNEQAKAQQALKLIQSISSNDKDPKSVSRILLEAVQDIQSYIG